MATEYAFPLAPATGGGTIPSATLMDSAGSIHQQIVLEFYTGSGDPTQVSPSNPLPVVLESGGVPATTDAASFTAGTTGGLPALVVYNDSLGAATSGTAVVPRGTANRAVLVAAAACATDGASTYSVIAPATPVAVQLKSGPGKVFNLDATSIATGMVWVKFFDSATTPTLGTTTANWSVGIPPPGTNVDWGDVGRQFTNGIWVVVTGGIGYTDNTPITAAQVTVNIGYK